MKNLQSKMANNITFIAVIGSALISELIKLTFEDQDNLFFITAFVIFATIIGLNFYNYLYQKRISKGNSPQSIAIKSSKLVSDYLKHLKEIIAEGHYTKKEDIILDEVKSISRPLLLLGEYKVRYLIGKKISQNTRDDEVKMRYMMDEMGWTSVLMGKERAIKEIEAAMDVFPVEIVIKNKKRVMDYTHKSDADLRKLFLVVRAKRHLASTPFLTIEKKLSNALDALTIMDYLKKVDYIDNIIPEHKRKEMLAGIHYALGETYYQKAHTFWKEKGLHYDVYEYLASSFKYARLTSKASKLFENQHRYLKALLLENSLINLFQEINRPTDFKKATEALEFSTDLAEMTLQDLHQNIATIEALLNTSIYVDEAFEIYLKQKIMNEGDPIEQ